MPINFTKRFIKILKTNMGNNRQNQHGFTLVELAVVMLIFGMLMSSITIGLDRYLRDVSLEETLASIDRTELALYSFQTRRDKYPCPADPTLAPGDANYGRADCTANPNIITVQGRDVDGDGNGELVLIGAAPTATLLDPNNDGDPADGVLNFDSMKSKDRYKTNDGLDGWGNKLTYAVTRNLTDAVPDNFNADAGAIFIVDEQDNNLLNEAGTAHAIILSHGANGKGAFTEDGNYVDDCVDIADPAEMAQVAALPYDERENCDYEEPAVGDAKFLKGIHNITNADYNDDHIAYMINKTTNLWEYTGGIVMENDPDTEDDDSYILQIGNTNGGFIGIGLAPQERFHLEGDLQAFKIRSETLCDEDGGNCMPTDLIGAEEGKYPDMKCPTGEVVVRIEQNKVFCENPFTAASFGPCTTPGELMIGISSTSGPICASR